MKRSEELKKFLLWNFVDEDGDLRLDDLDLSEFDGNVWAGYWKVKGNLFQTHNKVGGDLFQGYNEVGDNLSQPHNKVGGNIKQHANEVGGNLDQSDNKVAGKTYTDFDKHTKIMKLGEDVWITDFIVGDDYDSFTKEELITMLKEKEGNNENN